VSRLADSYAGLVAAKAIIGAESRAEALRKAVFGTMDYQQDGHCGPLAFHGAYRTCPFCGEWYKRHAGHVDHLDRCDPSVPTRDDAPRPPSECNRSGVDE